jgi:transposase
MSAAVDVIGQDGPMSSPPGPRAGGPRPRRVFTPAQKLAHLTGYDQACADGSGGGDYLRREGLYSSQITQWRQLRDGGALTGNLAGGTKTPKLTAEQLENARLKRQLEVTTRKLTTTAAALEIMGKLHALLDELSERADNDPPQSKR